MATHELAPGERDLTGLLDYRHPRTDDEGTKSTLWDGDVGETLAPNLQACINLAPPVHVLQLKHLHPQGKAELFFRMIEREAMRVLLCNYHLAGALYFKLPVGKQENDSQRLCIPNTVRRKALIARFLEPPRPDISTQSKRITKRHSNWKGLFRDVKRYEQTCDVCQRSKAFTIQAQVLLQPLPIHSKRWLSFSTDFVTRFPPARNGIDTALIVVDRFTERALFSSTTKRRDGHLRSVLPPRLPRQHSGEPRCPLHLTPSKRIT